MGANPNSKGAKNENLVRDMMYKWWGPLEPKAKFVRTPRSGGWHAGGDFDMAGDLMTTSKRFPFSVEVKARESWSLENFINGDRAGSPVWGWWAQCIVDAEKTGRVPFLIFKKNRKPWLVMLPLDYATKTAGMKCPNMRFEVPLQTKIEISVHPCVYLADNFFSHKPRIFAR